MATIQSFFTHQVQFSGLAPGAQDSDQVKIEADSDFSWYKATYFSDIAGATQTASTRVLPLVSVLITDNSNDRQLMRQAVPIGSLFGTGEIPFILPTPHVFKRNGTFSVQVSNFSSGTTYNLRLSFIGFKKFVAG